ncbi:MAG: ABC transporter ATP-binding protein [Ilumatobacteraceae bacterium]
MNAVDVRGVRVELHPSGADIVSDISFSLAPGEIAGLVGESGSGKTTIGTALLGHARRGARIVAGEVLLEGTDILTLGPSELRKVRGRVVSYVPQDPNASLNPALRIGEQLSEMLEVHHTGSNSAERRERIGRSLAEVKLPDDHGFLLRYPHQLSGGQQQRLGLAMAFILNPSLVVLDEPTTGLDVSTQAHVLSTVRALASEHKTAALYVTHDLAAVASIADRILVAYGGRLIEDGPTDRIFSEPGHPYTARLISASPDITHRRVLTPIPGAAPSPGTRPPGCSFRERCDFAEDVCGVEPTLVSITNGHAVRCSRITAVQGGSPVRLLEPRRVAARSDREVLGVEDLHVSYGPVSVLHGVSLAVHTNECLAIVGESGSGKTTLTRAVMGLVAPTRGKIRLDGATLSPRTDKRSAEARRRIQYIFQSPYNSLNPRRCVGDTLEAPIKHLFRLNREQRIERVELALKSVSLPESYLHRYPDQLSGGERQRVAIARALACEPDVLVCDEITSALDVSVQASIVALLEQLRVERDLAMIFVTHNLALVRTIADNVVVIERGVVVETGSAQSVLDSPQHAYTRSLLTDTPHLPTSREAQSCLLMAARSVL